MAARRKDGPPVPDTPSDLTKQIPQPILEEARAYLDDGRPLPDEFKSVLFETKREYEIVYAGKEREANILAETMAVPLQRTKVFGESKDPWSNMLIFGDNLQVLKTLLEMKADGLLTNADGSSGVRACYIDPPFASEREFRGTGGQAAYSDKVAGAEFIEFLRKRLVFIRELLADDGTLFVHLDWKKGHYIKIVLDELFGPSNFRNEIIWWYYNKMQGNIRRFASNHDVLYSYSKSEKYVFNPIREMREKPKRQQKRTWDKESQSLKQARDAEGKLIYYTETERTIDDVWRIPYLMPADRTEKIGYPTQKPKALIERIIVSSTNPGDLVLDAFVGSGTTAVAAEELERRWIAIDCGKLSIYETQKRLLKLGADKRTILGTKPFGIYNAGLYDYGLLRQLPWDEFKSFALNLFQCKSQSHGVGKVELDGFLRSDPVLVFDFIKNEKARLDESFIDDLHVALGERIGRRFFIIAPAASIDFLQDYVELEGPHHPVRYYVLRIPYSVIDEIHLRGFSRLQQPISVKNVNDTVDAVGFDFIQPPTMKALYSKTKSELTIKIKEFESEAMLRNGPKPEGLEALAMVMIDCDYDSSVFDLDLVLYGEELGQNDFAFSIPLQDVGKKIMIIYLDVFGNEHREVKTSADFRSSKG